MAVTLGIGYGTSLGSETLGIPSPLATGLPLTSMSRLGDNTMPTQWKWQMPYTLALTRIYAS